jgi:hypothetical protein
MPIGIYDTAVLVRVVQSLLTPQSFLLDRFFPMVDEQTTESIVFDVENGKRRMSPFVSPLVEGKVVADKTYTTNSLKPAYIKDKRVLRPNQSLKRRAGERIGGQMSPQERMQANLGTSMQDQLEMLTRRLEWMAAGALHSSKYTITGEGFPETEINFARDAALSVALTTTARWGESGVSIADDIEGWLTLMLKKSGSVVTDMIMTPDTWALFIADEKVKATLDTTVRGGSSSLDNGPNVKTGAVWKGKYGTYDVWVYNDWYVDDAGVEQPILPAYSFILASSQLEGVRHYGAILDEEAGLQPMAYFPKSWVKKDPSVRYLLMQSAPLVVPYRPNASFRATVR